MNELHLETSPYLLQHATNPIHWKAWNPSTLEQALTSQKLIIISVGYSACHWCHVMEKESFEDQEVAAIMNQHFISIKVDREERPDVDAVYMKAVQLMTGRGGWPMNVVALPDGRPIWGGTYFRKNEWINALEKLHELHVFSPEVIYEYAEKLHEGLTSLSLLPKNTVPTEEKTNTEKDWLTKWQRSFDWEYGGMARAPKFMMPNNYELLLWYSHHYREQELAAFVELTLTKMAYGGIFDTIDGGFSRYAVDLKWHVPHFEKMLYDNGQMVSLYAKAYQATQKPLFREVVEKTLAFVSREWLTNFGGFYAAFDADSLNATGKTEEGAYYVWHKKELQELLGNDFPMFAQLYNINDFGHWEQGNYVLIQTSDDAFWAQKWGWDNTTFSAKKKYWSEILLTHREKRSKPALDNKCLTAWNAIMCKGYLAAYKALETPEYLDVAHRNLTFILQTLRNEEGKLYRNYSPNATGILGYLEDYAHVIEACLEMYECTWEEKWLWKAKELTHYTFDLFFEENTGFFAFTDKDQQPLFVPHFEIEDNVIPAANSVMANNLFRLSIYFENNAFRETAEKMYQHVLTNIDYPSAFSNWLQLGLRLSDTFCEIAVTGTTAHSYLPKIRSAYYPNTVFCGSSRPSELPFLQNRWQESTLFYLCQAQTCQAPTDSFETIRNYISS